MYCRPGSVKTEVTADTDNPGAVSYLWFGLLSTWWCTIFHNARLVIYENNGLTIGEQKNAIQNCYNPLLTEFCDV